ncbi:unnamed protein product, partial [Meganyctiphanes norvegica]
DPLRGPGKHLKGNIPISFFITLINFYDMELWSWLMYMPFWSWNSQELFAAAKAGDVPVVQEALKLGADINWQNPDGYTPLHVASSKGHSTIVKLLLNANADVNIASGSF